MGTVEFRMIASRHSSRLPPVERSITVSAPQRSAHLSFSTSASVRCRRNRRRAHIGVYFGERSPADGHRFKLVLQMHLVGGNDHPPRRHFNANLFGSKVRLAKRHPLHLGRNPARTPFFKLCLPVNIARRRKVHRRDLRHPRHARRIRRAKRPGRTNPPALLANEPGDVPCRSVEGLSPSGGREKNDRRGCVSGLHEELLRCRERFQQDFGSFLAKPSGSVFPH